MGRMREGKGRRRCVKFDFYMQGDALIIEMQGEFRNKFFMRL